MVAHMIKVAYSYMTLPLGFVFLFKQSFQLKAGTVTVFSCQDQQPNYQQVGQTLSMNAKQPCRGKYVFKE